MLFRVVSFSILVSSLLSILCCGTVIWDAGHGSPDGGASGKYGTLEKDLTLKLALSAQEIALFLGIPSRLTRNSDESIYSHDAKTIRQKKVSDLQNRLSIAADTPHPIFVSIHTNAAAETISGLQVFFAPSESSDRLSMVMTAWFSRYLPKQRIRQPVKAPDHVYLTKNLRCPAVIVEYGFITNPQEEQLLSDPTYQFRLAFLSLCGICQYINEKGA